MSEQTANNTEDKNPPASPVREKPAPKPQAPEEIGGRGGLDPVRYGDWEIGGKCVDF